MNKKGLENVGEEKINLFKKPLGGTK